METLDDILNKVTSLQERLLNLKAVILEREKRKNELELECLSKGYEIQNLNTTIKDLETQTEKASMEITDLVTKLEKELKEYGC